LVYDEPRKLITIGFDAAKGAASEHHYDLLASEARAAVFAGVAKGEIPQEMLVHLDRSHVQYKGETVLQSWTGTMFEYLDAVAVDEVFARHTSGTKYAQSRCCAAKIRPPFFNSVGDFRIGMQLDQRRWTLPLFRVWSSGSCAAPAR